MKKRIFFAIFAVILVIAIFSACTRSAPKKEYSIVWIVEPELEYDNVYFCSMCGYTADSFLLDKSTGQTTGYHDGHGGPYYREWLYDSENKMIGMYIFGWDEELTFHPMDQFSTYFSAFSNQLNFFRQVDSTSIIREESEWGEVYYDLGSKYENSRYSVAHGSVFLTKFNLDRPDNLSAALTYRSAVPISSNGKWGFMDINGHLVVPYNFDHAVSSDGDTAFVKIDGKYGILDVRKSSGR